MYMTGDGRSFANKEDAQKWQDGLNALRRQQEHEKKGWTDCSFAELVKLVQGRTIMSSSADCDRLALDNGMVIRFEVHRSYDDETIWSNFSYLEPL